MLTEEQFADLLALSKERGVKLDYEDVPLHKRSDPFFFDTYEWLYKQITDLHWVSAFCLHEAGHKLYLALVGVTEFETLPAKIGYSSTTFSYEGHFAAIQVKKLNPPESMPMDQFIWSLARSCAAGAVLAQHLANAPRTGGDGDWARFVGDCKQLEEATPGLKIDIKSVWAQAQIAIPQDMQNPRNREAAFAAAEEIKADIFPWMKEPLTPFPKSAQS